jgi:cytochrome c-type biogenesis protein CcmH/NrfF
VVNDYVERHGTDVLANSAVKQEGRSVLGWVLPFIGALMCLGILIAVVEHIRRRAERRAPPSDRSTRHAAGTGRKRVKRR